MSTMHEQEPFRQDPDDLSLDESLVHLCRILLPRLKLILCLSIGMGLIVGVSIYSQPQKYESTAIISPGGVRDTIDLVQYQITDESSLINNSTVNQISQLNVLAKSSQVKKALISEFDLMKKWNCETELECIRKLSDMYAVKEVRNVGLEITATSEDEEFAFALVTSGIEQTNNYFENHLKSNAEKSSTKIKNWIEDATKQYQLVSQEFIKFASDNFITDIDQQNKDAQTLLNSLKNMIVAKETELIQKQQEVSSDSIELKPVKEVIKELKMKMNQIQYGTFENIEQPVLADYTESPIYFPTSKYQMLKIQYQNYQNKLGQLQSQLDLFTKRLATVELEAESSLQSLITLDEPVVQPASKGTLKFAVLTIIGAFFMLCIYFIFSNYIKELKKLLQEKKE